MTDPNDLERRVAKLENDNRGMGCILFFLMTTALWSIVWMVLHRGTP